MNQTPLSRRHPIQAVFLLGLILAFSFSPANIFGQTVKSDRPPTEELLPESTVVFIQMDNIRDFMTKMNDSSIGKMLADESVAPLAESLWGEAKSAYSEVQDQVGVSLEDLQAFPAGEITFAVIAPRRKDPEFMLIIQTDPESEAVDRILDRGREVVAEQGEEITADESADGIKFESFNVDGTKVTFFRKDGLMVGSTSQDELNHFIDRWMGREVEKVRPLSENRKFITILNRCRGTKDIKPEARFFIDPIELAKSATRGDAGSQLAINFLPVFGLDGLLGIGGSMLLSEDEFTSVVHAHVLLAEPRKGVFEMLAFRPTSYEPEPWLPKDISNYFTTSWDINQMLVELTKIIETFQEPGTVDKFFTETADKELEFNVREELIGNLTGRVTFVQWIEPPMRANSQVPLFALEVKDPAAMEKTLEKIFARANRDQPEDSEFRWSPTDHKGIQIYGMAEDAIKNQMERGRERRRQRQEEQGQTPSDELDIEMNSMQPSMALVGNYLLFSQQSRKVIEQVIETDQGDSESLAENKDYQRISSKMTRLLKTDMPAGIFYADPRVTFRWMFELATSENSKSLMAEQAVENKYIGGIKNAMDQNPLPEFGELEHYFQPQGGFMTSDETGFHFLMFELKAGDEEK